MFSSLYRYKAARLNGSSSSGLALFYLTLWSGVATTVRSHEKYPKIVRPFRQERQSHQLDPNCSRLDKPRRYTHCSLYSVSPNKSFKQLSWSELMPYMPFDSNPYPLATVSTFLQSHYISCRNVKCEMNTGLADVQVWYLCEQWWHRKARLLVPLPLRERSQPM
jgi:hypothetical protein